MTCRTIGLLLLLGLAAAPAAQAMPVLFEGIGTGALSGTVATALFEQSGANLVVTLSNVGADVLVPTDVLTGVFFDLAGSPTLTSASAVLAPGSTVQHGTSNPGGVVGGEWGYGHGLSGAPRGATQGISSTGLGLFGGATFPGTNLEGPAALDGLQYGIVSGNDDPTTGNAPVTGGYALIQNSVVFTLGGLNANFDLSTGISKVSFQYGTALADPNLEGHKTAVPVPEPASAALFAVGFFCLLAGTTFRSRARLARLFSR
jgi:hypothetical protein